MKFSRSETHKKSYVLPELRFEDQKLTSFSGLILFQKLFESLGLKQRLRQCFRHLKVSPIFSHTNIVLLLVIHMLLGYRDLRHVRYYEDDPLVGHVLGLRRLPDVATISRALSGADEKSVNALQGLLSNLVLERLSLLDVKRVTLDFDGSVIGTGRYAEGTAVGFNRKKKGQRSYYPLFCTVAQTSQVLDVLHRSGNVHDSNGALAFILQCIEKVRLALPGSTIEVRMDGAFFSDELVSALDDNNVEYTISVPFERFTELKDKIEERCLWYQLNGECDYFESNWKPKSWRHRRRFVFVRQTAKVQNKQPVQLDLFIPYAYGYEFKFILTNKSLTAAKVVAYQEKRPALWSFEQIDTLRKRIIQRAGRLIRPQNRLTLSMSANESIKSELLQILEALK